ncbi:hypothetical protein P154DRAFT_538600 [Amniculicola lignicola CBS 123094]|uniref:Uncharacterized protein n=1 Tax=Amniculicola lignicola CBS 123094 TaxID=1392246 RepID=A0A6A5W3H0_9PLEO|nr:hypothetical protein P154DRAFT_538600 [Amniculicola lignicola CBS 123094]
MRHACNTTSPSTGHRNKRPYQPPITSFFAREDFDEYSSDEENERGPGPITRSHTQLHHSRASRSTAHLSLAPAVPGHVQSNLLSVGMRVRKSVPEGYKTHKTSATSFPTVQTAISTATTSTTLQASGEAVPDEAQHQRELLPFCGLHKIGGFADQPVTNVHLYGGVDENGDRPVNIFPLPAAAFNQPFSSQSSTTSSLSTDSMLANPLNPNKRAWQEEDTKLRLNGNFMFALPVTVSEDEVPVSPLSETPRQGFNSLPQVALRPFAQPKTRRNGAVATRIMEVDAAALFKESGMDIDDENVDERNPNDFEDAQFLRPWPVGSREVDMGGV